VFYEGVWDQRLEYLAELPRGKTIGEFQDSDIFKVKEIVGDTMCIFGGMPIPLLKNGTPEEIRERTKEVCERAGKDGGFIMAPSVMELEGIKPENIQVWVDATKEFGVY
jgi:uroporphyrinogen-III decarboxylase